MAVYLLLPGNDDQCADEVFTRDSRWVVPELLFSEFRNVLVGHMRRGHMNLKDAVAYATEAETVFERAPFSPASTRILELSLNSGCTAYDCEFVALAEMLNVPLVTADHQVLQAFPGLAFSTTTYLSF